jgi:hypothetical protein
VTPEIDCPSQRVQRFGFSPLPCSRVRAAAFPSSRCSPAVQLRLSPFWPALCEVCESDMCPCEGRERGSSQPSHDPQHAVHCPTARRGSGEGICRESILQTERVRAEAARANRQGGKKKLFAHVRTPPGVADFTRAENRETDRGGRFRGGTRRGTRTSCSVRRDPPMHCVNAAGALLQAVGTLASPSIVSELPSTPHSEETRRWERRAIPRPSPHPPCAARRGATTRRRSWRLSWSVNASMTR